MINPFFSTPHGQLFHGDCLEVMKEMPDNSVDLTVTSPPYDNLREYNGFSFDFEGIAKQLFRITKQGGVVVWVVGDATIDGNETFTSLKQALYFKEQCGFNAHDTMIYQQAGTGAKGSNLAYWQNFEFMFIFSKGTPKTVHRIADIFNSGAGKKRSISPKMDRLKTRTERNVFNPEMSIRPNVWYYAVGVDNKTEHPAPFPINLARDHVISWSNEGDLVFDPFMGSGTTAVACESLGRKWAGSELSEEYCQIAAKRIKKASEQFGLFESKR